MMLTTHRTLLALLATATLVATGCGSRNDSNADDTTPDKEETLPVPVEVATIRNGDITAVYSGTASLEADGEATAMAKVGGELLRLLVNEGDQVEAGQVLALVDDARLRLEVQRSKANLEKAEQEYRRNVELHQKGLLPAGTFEGLKYDLDALKAQYALAALELSHTKVKAPISGIISARLVKVGNTIAANTPVFRITDLDPLLAYIYVPERDYQKLAADQPVTLSVDALPGEVFGGRIQTIAPVIDPNTGTFKVTVEINDRSGALKPGMFGRVNVVYDTRSGVPLVPRVALLDSDSETSVFVVRADEDAVERKTVAIGYSSGGNVEVLSGLAAGDRVVVIGQAGLKENSKVQIIEPGASVARIRPDKDKGKSKTRDD